MSHNTYQTLDMDQRSIKKFYSSVDSSSYVPDDIPYHAASRGRLMNTVKWVTGRYHETSIASTRSRSPSETAFNEKMTSTSPVDYLGLSRQRSRVFQLLFGPFVLMILLLFGTRSLILSYDMSQTDLVQIKDESWVDLVKDIPSSDSIRNIFIHYASHAHLAGSHQDYDLALWTLNQFKHFGLENASIETYYPHLNYPVERKLSIISGPEELLYVAKLDETKDSTPAFHAYSASGNVTGSIVYVNYGRLEDFVLLETNKIELNGTIALMRHGQIPSSIKIQHAEAFGCLGALVYLDPTEKTRATTLDVVHRESVEYGFVYPGDPFTPGVAATLNGSNESAPRNLPSIPSLPISWSDALPLLRATQGFGVSNPDWVGGLEEVGYFTGPSVAQCNLVNYNEFKKRPIWNVVARIEGHDDDSERNQTIILGNHRDAWDQGAADPSSGSAVLLELARVLGILSRKGWKPRRSIMLVSWDANEYGSVGSTEFVEDHFDWISQNVVAYLDVGHAVSGPHFSAQSSPLISRLLEEVTSMVIDPRTSKTVYDAWLEQNKLNASSVTLVPPIGTTSGLDSLAFFEHAGIPSLSISFDGNQNFFHSAFDSIQWMEQIGDPTFEYHQTMVRIWGLLALRLSSEAIIPFYPVDYTAAMKHYLSQLLLTWNTDKPPVNDTLKHQHEDSLLPLLTFALDALHKTSMKFNDKVESIKDALFVVNKKHRKHKKSIKKLNQLNNRLIQFERIFVQNKLLTDRPWYRHALFAPSAKSGLLEAFPSLVESKELNDSNKTSEAERALVVLIKEAQSILSKGNLGNKQYHSFDKVDEIFL
ncbi:MAG: hypothetical protein EXX96DRAFT_536870 [Benjaminiella poitrasii]|nr:MAG: hypothetical protein EXX96DRAFT_536870 [Benjaminiella poitrasii]